MACNLLPSLCRLDHATSEMGMTELRRGLENPLAVVKTINAIRDFLAQQGNKLVMSSDMKLFQRVRQEVRQSPSSPMFDHEITQLDGKAFWLGLTNDQEEHVALQACRLDLVDTSLAEWAVGWMSGLYMKRDTLMIPSKLEPFPSSKAYRVSGRIVYHGELWLEPSPLRGSGVASAFCLLGMVMAHLKWQPNAIWALVSNRMATSGHPIRFGYPTVERSFLNWAWSPDDVPSNEWLLLADFEDMERITSEYGEIGPIFK